MKSRSTFTKTQLATVLAVASLLAGCGTTTHIIAVKPDFKFTLTPERKPGSKLALLIDRETRTYNVEARRGSKHIYVVAVGTVLDTAATQALRASFQAVRTIESRDLADAAREEVLQIRFGPETAMLLARTRL